MRLKIWTTESFLTETQQRIWTMLGREFTISEWEKITVEVHLTSTENWIRKWDKLWFEKPEKIYPIVEDFERKPPEIGVFLSDKPFLISEFPLTDFPVFYLYHDHQNLEKSQIWEDLPCVFSELRVFFKGNHHKIIDFTSFSGHRSICRNEKNSLLQGFALFLELYGKFFETNAYFLPVKANFIPKRNLFYTYTQLFINSILNSLHNRVKKKKWKLKIQSKSSTSPLSLSVFPKTSYADPFPFEWQGKTYLFAEAIDEVSEKGSLVVASFNGANNLLFETILATYHHLSFPFVFAYKNEIYLLPEMHEIRQIALYRASDFPKKWELFKILLDGIEATDSVLHYWNEKWWLFATLRHPLRHSESSAHHDTLYLFSADNPLSDNWIPHPKNPIVRDIRAARNAGYLQEKQGKLYRIAQISTPHYGYGYQIMEITQLTPTDYEEKIVSVHPNSQHTWNVTGNWCFSDTNI